MNKTYSKKTEPIFIVTGLIFLIQGITLILPFFWMLLTSFKGLLDFQNSFVGLPKVWHWENFSQVFKLL